MFPEWSTYPGQAHSPAQEGIPDYSLLQMMTGFGGFGVSDDKTSNTKCKMICVRNFADLKK